MAFWGKGRPDLERPARYPRQHPIAWHLLDVAATLGAILDARPATRERGARLLGVEPATVRSLLVVLAGLHDLGKFAPAFQAKDRDLWREDLLGAFRKPADTHHTDDGYALWRWRDGLHRKVGPRIWPEASDVLDTLAPAVFGHHGRPVVRDASRAGDSFRVRDSTTPLDAALACAEAVTALLLPEPIAGQPPERARVARASWWVAGLLTLADWVGSRQAWFRYEPADVPIADYWALAKTRATYAVRAAGLAAAPIAGARTFAEIAGYAVPSPAQAWAAERAPLGDGPTLVLVEDVTGAGKTEAAQMLVHRLMAAGRATGAYWAMPTQATANAMYGRQRDAIRALYAAGGVQPSLALAHGQARLDAGFRASVLAAPAPGEVHGATGASGAAGPALESGAACAAFLADDRRAALLADVGAGTVDQAVLGVLPSRFNTLRLLGLSDKVLVLDEAHAYDAYVAEEVQTLLRFHAALGGSAVVLSATLSQVQRQGLVSAWLDGCAGGRRLATPVLREQAYPLATVVDGASATVTEHPLEAAETSARTVAVRFVHAEAEAAGVVADGHARGAATCWIRNTVRDCLEAAAGLRARGVPVLVFHARFAQADRQRRERLVVRLFGKAARDARRRRCVLLASQVVEQSLDLDFDVLVSDVAPVDLLVQRAGRLWRHPKRNEARIAAGLKRELVVLAPPFEAEPPKDWVSRLLPGTAAVYRDVGVLWRTVEALDAPRSIVTPGVFGAPGAVRTLVEAVYGEGARERVPDALRPAADKAFGDSRAHTSIARQVVLSVAEGYHGATKGWVDDVRAPTRLGGDQTAIRLARDVPGTPLVPWAAGAPDDPAWKRWALSEVRVSAHRVPPGSATAPEHAAAVNALRGTWGRFEQDVPVLALMETATPGEWAGALVPPKGGRIVLRYTHADGLLLP